MKFQFRRALLLLLLALLLPAAWAKKTPDPTFKTLDGQKQKLSALRGQILVVNFWATWCGPCQEELPRLSKIADAYAGKNVKFIFISADTEKSRPKIPATLDHLHVGFTSWVDADLDTLDAFNLGNLLPATMVMDENGQIIARVMGEAKEADVTTPVDWLLGGKKGPAPAEVTKRF